MLINDNRQLLGSSECQWRLLRQSVVWSWEEFCIISLVLKFVLLMEADPTLSQLEELNTVVTLQPSQVVCISTSLIVLIGYKVRPDLCATNCSRSPREFCGKFYTDSLVHDSNALRMLLDVIGKV